MNKKDKDYLISAGVLMIVGWFAFGIICYTASLILCFKVSEKSTLSTVMKIISIVGIVLCLILYF